MILTEEPKKMAKSNVVEQAQNFMLTVLEGGVPGITSVHDLAKEYMGKYYSTEEACDALVTNQVIKSGSVGFLAGAPGAFSWLATIPTDVAVSIAISLQTIGTVAVMNGYDLKDDAVFTMVLACLAGESAEHLVRSEVVKLIMKSIGKKGVARLGRCVPLVGGVVGAVFNGLSTKAIGELAIKTFSRGGAYVYSQSVGMAA